MPARKGPQQFRRQALILLLLLAALAGPSIAGGGLPISRAAAMLLGCLISLSAAAGLVYALTAERRNERAHRLLEISGLGVAEWRLGRGLHHASPLWREMCGGNLDPAEQPLQWLQNAHHLDAERAATSIGSLMRDGGADDCCEPLRLRSGPGKDWRWFELHAHAQHRDRAGRVTHLLTTLRDITAQRTAEERQRMSISLFQHVQEGLLITDTDFQVLDLNPGYCQMIRAERAALLGQIPTPLLESSLRQSGLAPELIERALQAEGFWEGRVVAERADGSPCTLHLSISPIPEPDGPLRYRVVTVSDLTQSLQHQQQLERQARYDTLTGLPNHEEFMRRLRFGLAASEREGFRLSVCRVDLDQFKRVNNQHGTPIADALLLQVAQRLQGALRSAAQWSDVVARLGGDEFALVLRATSPEESQLALERLLNVLRAPYHLETKAGPLLLEITASIGATLYPLDNSDAETLLRHAGHALYRVKHAGRNGFGFFDTAKRLRDEASLIAIARVQEALDHEELRLYYQPSIDMQTGEVLGMEALLRWQHPERGLLGPVHFLPQIEHTGLMVQVGDWVIEQALRQSERWLGAGLHLSVSVNVTARQLQAPDFALRLKELIQRHEGPVAKHLCLEVLESAALADVAATHTLIQDCKAFGVSFALDDFGTGYSTLTYLQKLPVDALKVDRSFVQNMLVDRQDMALVEGVIGLARHFGCSVIAEGVESAAHARALLRMGCRRGQGNGIAQAMPAADVHAWVDGFVRTPWLLQTPSRESAAS